MSQKYKMSYFEKIKSPCGRCAHLFWTSKGQYTCLEDTEIEILCLQDTKIKILVLKKKKLLF